MNRKIRKALTSLANDLSEDPNGMLLAKTPQGAISLGPVPLSEKALSDYVYQRYFACWRPEATDPFAHHLGTLGSPAFVSELSSACGGATYFESGWRVTKPGPDWAFVSAGLLDVFVSDASDLPTGFAGLSIGQEIQLRLPCLRENIVPYFVYAVSRRGRISKVRPFFKFYLNVEPRFTATILKTLLMEEDTRELVFELKAPNRPQDFCRVDAVVIYVAEDSYSGMLEVLRRQHQEHLSAWRDETPLFTRELLPGLAVAESPSEAGETVHSSYGETRCRLLARAIREAWVCGERAPAAWASRLSALLRELGVDENRPYLAELRFPRTRAARARTTSA